MRNPKPNSHLTAAALCATFAAIVTAPAEAGTHFVYGDKDPIQHFAPASVVQVGVEYYRLRIGELTEYPRDSMDLWGGTIRYLDNEYTGLMYGFSYRTGNFTPDVFPRDVTFEEWDLSLGKKINENILVGITYFNYEFRDPDPAFGGDGWMLYPTVTALHTIPVSDRLFVTPRATLGLGHWSEKDVFGGKDSSLAYFVETVLTLASPIAPGIVVSVEGGYRSFTTADFGQLSGGPLVRGVVSFEF